MSVSRLLFFLVVVGGIVVPSTTTSGRLSATSVPRVGTRRVGIAGLGRSPWRGDRLALRPRSVAPLMFVYVWIGSVLPVICCGATSAGSSISDDARGAPDIRRACDRAPARRGVGWRRSARGVGMANALRPLAGKRIKCRSRCSLASVGTALCRSHIHVGRRSARSSSRRFARGQRFAPISSPSRGPRRRLVEELGALVAPLARLRAKDGVFFVRAPRVYSAPQSGRSSLRRRESSSTSASRFRRSGRSRRWTIGREGVAPDTARIPRLSSGAMTRGRSCSSRISEGDRRAAPWGRLVLFGAHARRAFIPWNSWCASRSRRRGSHDGARRST